MNHYDAWKKLTTSERYEACVNKAALLQEDIDREAWRQAKTSLKAHVEILGPKAAGLSVREPESIRVTAIHPTQKNGGAVLCVTWPVGRFMNRKKKARTFAQGFVGHVLNLLKAEEEVADGTRKS